MGTDDLIFLVASDWFVAHADVIGLLPGLDQDGVEEVSVAARTPIQRLMAQADNYSEVSFEPARIAASAAEFLDGCRDPGIRQAAADLLARFAVREEGKSELPPDARLDALLAAGKADFTSWDESLDLFRAGEDGWLLAYVRALSARPSPPRRP